MRSASNVKVLQWGRRRLNSNRGSDLAENSGTHLWLFATGIVVAALLVLRADGVSAQGVPPGLPANYFGSVVVNGQPPADGTQVKAIINGKDCTQAGNSGTVRVAGISSYAITVPHESQTPGCGKDGVVVQFEIGGQKASQQSTWGTATMQVNLSIGAATPPPLPTSTPSATPNATQAVATATADALFTPLPAPSMLPTDEPIFPSGTSVPAPPGVSGQGAGAGAVDEDDDGGSLMAPVLVLLALLLAAGVGGGVLFAKKRGGES